jgi:hypothetical protein
MKKPCFKAVIFVSLLVLSEGLRAQTVNSDLDQLKLSQLFPGSWQTVVGKDSIEVTESQQFGKSFVEQVYLVINDKKSLSYVNSFCFIPKQKKFLGFINFSNGYYITWIGSFVTEKKFSVNFLQNFNPESDLGKLEMDFEIPDKITMTQFSPEGIITGENTANKVK